MREFLKSGFMLKYFENYEFAECLKIHTQNYCSEYINTVIHYKYKTNFEYLNPDLICENLCSNYTLTDDSDYNFAKRVLYDRPPLNKNKGQIITKPSKIIRFLVFGDIHVDSQYTKVFFA